MKINEIITEAEVKPYQSSVLDVHAAVAMLNKHCSQAISMIEHPLWRGMKNHSEEILTIDPSTGERKSQNTTNHYTALMDNSPYFKGWPKRSKSLICSSARLYASGYASSWSGGALYAIFPFNGVPIAVCPRKDMWFTPVKLPALGLEFDVGEDYVGDDTLNEFNRILRITLELPSDYQSMLAHVNSPRFAELLKRAMSRESAANRRLIPTPADFIPYLQKCLAPQNTGTRLLSIQEFAAQKPENKECWVGGPVVAIREDMYEKFLDAVQKRNAFGPEAVADNQSMWKKKAVKKPTNKVPPAAHPDDKLLSQLYGPISPEVDNEIN